MGNLRDYLGNGSVLLLNTPFPRLQIALIEDEFNQFISRNPDPVAMTKVGWDRGTKKMRFGYVTDTKNVFYNYPYYWVFDLTEKGQGEDVAYLKIENEETSLLKVDTKYKDVLDKYTWHVQWIPHIMVYPDSDYGDVQIAEAINAIKESQKSNLSIADVIKQAIKESDKPPL